MLAAAAAALALSAACSKDYPVDDDGLLITDSEECYISSFILRGTDDRDVLVSSSIDDDNLTITGVAAFGTNLKKVKPECGVSKDSKIVGQKMGVWTDFTQPQQYTVVSGNLKVRKTYTITVTVQGE